MTRQHIKAGQRSVTGQRFDEQVCGCKNGADVRWLVNVSDFSLFYVVGVISSSWLYHPQYSLTSSNATQPFINNPTEHYT